MRRTAFAGWSQPIADRSSRSTTAMKTGFNWELGPFEMLDAAGVRATTEKMRAAGAADRGECGEAAGGWWRELVSRTIRRGVGAEYFDPVSGRVQAGAGGRRGASLAVIKKAHGVVKKNAGASVIDLGDGVAAIELHSKMNALGEDIVSLDYADAEAGERCGGELRGVRDHGRCGEFFGRREPDAAAAGGAGRGVGRGRADGARSSRT